MPFNGSGTFSIVNTFVPNTTILSAAVNQNFTDIATGLSDCLTRDNQAGMTGVFRAVSGSLGAPGIAFNSDTTAGLYLARTGVMGLVAKSLGIQVNSAVFQLSSAAVSAGGSGYVVGDTITFPVPAGVITPAVVTVATLSGSAVATVTVTYPGNYDSAPSNPVSQSSTSGVGTGATFNFTMTTQFTRSAVVAESGVAPWVRFGSSSFVAGLMSKANAYDYLVSLATFSSGFSINKTTSPPTITTSLNPTLVPNYISGLQLSTAGSSGTFGIAVGVANDTTNVTLMQLASAYTKTTASWAVGTGNGGLDTGAIATNTWYHVYLIERTDTAVVDVLFSLSASSPTMPGGGAYDRKRRIGSMKTNGSSQWILFTQTGGTFIWDTGIQDANAVTTTTSRVNVTLTVPTNVVVTALYRAQTNAGVSGNQLMLLSLQESDQAPSSVVASLLAAASGVDAAQFATLTDTSARITARSNSTNSTYSINTYGWVDSRGQQ